MASGATGGGAPGHRDYLVGLKADDLERLRRHAVVLAMWGAGRPDERRTTSKD
jgi:hypothetical protein